ncbi:hypothetical protein M9H77_06974 [Catharanthus roseus]|uniref:Uncharacterized protein n=1 Tax=Catharanthus roseus TaxID=4058 RepID=A0ACC0BTM1_CATRO|nr:hypothetical protein M9H77_06974 [Catharanthus roseus]
MDERFHKRRGDVERYPDIYDHYEHNYGEQEVEFLLYTYGVREEEKFRLVLKSLSYEVNVSWDFNCENRRRIGLQPIKTWGLLKQAWRTKYGVENHERLGQGQAKVKFMESSMVEEILKLHTMEEKRIVGQGSFNEGKSVIESISTSLEECC